ncbi:MAG: DNA polymerase-3 subunit chi [Lysobacterales bacterium]|jgi:DNA polymerase-3 subunit chi
MTSSCQVDFYVLSSPGLDATQMACRLALMSWQRGHRTMVVAESAERAVEIDSMMWKSPPDRFLPHELASNANSESAPVLIILFDDLSTGSQSENLVVINLCQTPIPDPARFSRLLEIVPQQDDARKASRTKFKYYREQGITPGSHEISK